MFVIKPKKVRIESSLSKKQIIERYERKTVSFKARGSIIGISGLLKKYKLSEIYYGNRNGDKIRVSHHAPKKKDGSSTTFYGTVSETENATVIEGKIMKPVTTCVFAAVWLVCVLFFALVCYALENTGGAAAFSATAIIGFLIMFLDGGKTVKLMDFLNKISDTENKNSKE